VEVAPLNEPHVGEQSVPPAFKLQETPEFVESFCTVAFNVVAAAPAAMVEILLVIVTEIGVVPEPYPLPQPIARRTLVKAATNKSLPTAEA
jgi:hypothetical protein